MLQRLEREQTRNTGLAGIVFNAFALAASPFLGGDRLAWLLFMIAVSLALLNNAFRWYTSANEERFREVHLFVFIGVAAVTDCGVVYYLGAFGAVLVMFVINLYTACSYYGRRVAFATLVASCFPVVVLGTAYATGLLEDPGVVTPFRARSTARTVAMTTARRRLRGTRALDLTGWHPAC